MHQIRSKNCLNYNMTTLYREVGGRVRYYTLQYYPTLFGDWLLERAYGSLKNKKPTRVIKKYFSHFEEMEVFISRLIKSKVRKGYSKDMRYERSVQYS